MWLSQALVTVVAFATLQSVLGEEFFKSAGLAGKTSCEECTRNDCLFFHEAKDEKCVDVCKKKIEKDDDTESSAAPSGSTAPPDDGKKKKKGGGGKCFHGDDTVITNYGPMKMSELSGRENIEVLSRNADNTLSMSPVFSWLHLDPVKVASFLVMTTESGRQLSITPTHLIQSTKCDGVERVSHARRVEEGECLMVRDDNGQLQESKIVKIVQEDKVGIYAPLTENGNIVVNGVLASCYTDFENEALQKIIYSFLQSIRSVVSQLVPSYVVEMIYNSPFDSVVRVPQVFLSFIDLAKPFVN